LVAHDGRHITLRSRYTGEAFELQGQHDRGRAATVGEALMDETIIASLPWATFVDVVLPRAGQVVDTLLRQALEEERLMVQEFAFSTVKARLAHKLAALADGRPIGMVQKTREELAALVGTRPEEVTKILADLREDGLVHYQPYARSIVILQADALAGL
jgi:CRP-like cAMP-binding protein